MNVIRYASEESQRKQYLDLVSSYYKSVQNFPQFFAEIMSLTSPDNATQKHQRRVSVAVEVEGIFVAHCTLILDEREQPGTAWFGFFECPDDRLMFDLLWKSVLEECRSMKIQLLRGPINGTIWYPYRFALPETSGIPPFQGELLCKNYYSAFFAGLPEAQEQRYYSAMREDFTDLIRITKPFHDSMLADSSLTLEGHLSVSTDILKEIFSLARTVFAASWANVPVSNEELLAFYSEEKLKTLFRAYTLRCGNDLIGFATVFRENDETLILKTLAVGSAFQGKGLGNALIHRIHADAVGHCTRMIYALIRYENNVKRLPKDGAVIFREYSAWEIPVH